MKREIIKIQEGNDTQISIRALLPDGKTQVPIDDTEGFKVEDVKFTINGHEVEVPYYSVDNGLLVVQIDSDLALGKYGIHVKGKIVTQKPLTLKPDVDCNFYEVFEIVPYSDNIRYDNYYTDIFIVGLPDSTYEQLRKDLEEKIAYYQHLIDELNRGEVATKSDLGLAPGETVAGLIKAGGGGGLTPEQYDALAKKTIGVTNMPYSVIVRYTYGQEKPVYYTCRIIALEGTRYSIVVNDTKRYVEQDSNNVYINVEGDEKDATLEVYSRSESTLAKEATLDEIKDLLTLADGEVTAELQTLIPNEEETV